MPSLPCSPGNPRRGVSTHLRQAWALRITAASVQVSSGSPLSYDRYRVNERIALIEGSSYVPQVLNAKERMEAAYQTWRASNPRVRRPDRFNRPEGWVPAGYNYFMPHNSAPGTVAFIDLEVMGGMVRIAYMAVRPDRRGQGSARRLIQEAYDRHPSAIFHWGRMLSPEIGHLYDRFRESEPERTTGGRPDY